MTIDPGLLVEWLTQNEPSFVYQQSELAQEVAQLQWTGQQWQDWFTAMSTQVIAGGSFHAEATEAVIRRATEQLGSQPQLWTESLVTSVGSFYEALDGKGGAAPLLLALFIVSDFPKCMDAFSEIIVHQPPPTAAAVAIAFRPLFDGRDTAIHLFPRLLDAIPQITAAAAVFDLANYLMRSGIIAEHPAAARAGELVGLLSELVRRLEYFEEEPIESEEQFQSVAIQVGEATAITIGLCDALALIGAEEAIPKLHLLQRLRHRRLQVEAAAALVRLGDESGASILAKLAAEPIVRLHAVQFADELGCGTQIDPCHRTPEALAEAQFALALAQPTRFGVPPAQLEVIDRRRWFWPGYETPVECFLIRYAYSVPEGTWSNIGMTGPSPIMCSADLGNLAPADIYAVFAGLDTEHEEILHWDSSEWAEHHLAEIARGERTLRDSGYLEIQPTLLARFFGDWLLVAKATWNQVSGMVVVDEQGARWFAANGPRPLGTREIFALYKGKRLLKVFNDLDEDSPEAETGEE